MLDSPIYGYLKVSARPPQATDIDWGTAPLRSKLYRHCEQIPFSYENPSFAPRQDTHLSYDRAGVGQMLRDMYGITRHVHTVQDSGVLIDGGTPLRPVPSGGALFPCELYAVFCGEECVPPGVYHYDPVHHALDVLRIGDYASFLDTSFARIVDTSPMCVLLLTSVFWKNGFKYGAFSYRLQALDAGCIISQAQVVAQHFGLQSITRYQFVDRNMNHLLGVERAYESTYAAIALHPASVRTDESARIEGLPTLHALADEQRATKIQPLYTHFSLGSISTWPECEALHEASLMESPSAFRQPGDLPPIPPLPPEPSRCVQLGPACISGADLYTARHARRSAVGQFMKASLTQDHLVQLLAASTSGYPSDLDGHPDFIGHTQVYCVVNAVNHFPPGAYRFHPGARLLEPIQDADWRRALNGLEANVCVFVVGSYTVGVDVYGDRWYRMQNMEAGIVVQRLYLGAAFLGLGCRASLGFDGPQVDRALCLPDGYTALIQVAIAGERPAHQLFEQRLPDLNCASS